MTSPAVVTPVVPSKAKAWLAVLGSVLAFTVPLVTSVQDYLPAPWPSVLGGVIVILTGLGVYRAPYAPNETTIVHNDDVPAINAGTTFIPNSDGQIIGASPTGPAGTPPAASGGPYQNPWGE